MVSHCLALLFPTGLLSRVLRFSSRCSRDAQSLNSTGGASRLGNWHKLAVRTLAPGGQPVKFVGLDHTCLGAGRNQLVAEAPFRLPAHGTTSRAYPSPHTISRLDLRGHSSTSRFPAMSTAQSSFSTSSAAGKLSVDSIRVASDGKTRLATFRASDSGLPTVGVVKDGQIWAMKDAVAAERGDLGDMASVIAAWPGIQGSLQLDPSTGTALEDVTFLAPIPLPAGPIMCIGKNYVEHVKEVDTWKTAPNITAPSIPQHPIVFTKAPQSVTGTDAPILLPPPHVSAKVDYEAELAVIIGKPGKGITEDKAMEHVFGYTILNDVTARDVQKLHQQWFLGKSCDTFCPMGPFIVLASEVDGRDLSIKCWVNDELRQNGRTSQLIFSIPVLIATVSKAMTLRPGDILATGTPSGVGSGFNPPRHLKAGDSVRIQIEGLGELVNQVAEG